MADKKLSVSVTGQTDKGVPFTYQAGETPTKEHAEFITNPDVWEADEVPTPTEDNPVPGPGLHEGEARAADEGGPKAAKKRAGDS